MLNKKVYLTNENLYNHGCSNYAIGVIKSVSGQDVTIEITESNSCHSCWQVGHDADYTYHNVGETIILPADDLQDATNNYDVPASVDYFLEC
jgi:hypothetical protein